MKNLLFRGSRLALGAMALSLVALPAQAAMAKTTSAATTATSSTTCNTDPVLTQPFLAYRDSNWYTLVPGQTPDNFQGTGWTLTGGAKLLSSSVLDGSTGSVLDLPPGSTVTSPIMCVESGMNLARMITRVVGGPENNSTSFQVYSAAGKTIGGSMGVNGGSSWALSPPVNVVPGSFSGWESVYFTFTAKAKAGDLQLYDFYVDPRMR